MLLARVVRDLIRNRGAVAADPVPSVAVTDDRPSVLNVGGGSKQIPIPPHYFGWNHLLRDIDPAGGPDIVCDARDLVSLEAGQFDAIYCSHNLEHYYQHDGAKVLRGFLHVLKPQGFAEIRVPDLRCVMKRLVATGMDIEDTLYVSPGGPISVRDVIYGWGKQIEQSGVDFYAHKTGFTPASLRAVLEQTGFAKVFVGEIEEAFEIRALAFKTEPTDLQRTSLGVR
jgi:SAM-dependent methyltransferase